MDHQAVIDVVAEALRDAPGIRGLFLSGSYGTGLADAYSDIDFILVAEDGPTDAVAAQWREAIGQTGEIILCWDRTTRPALINAITADWTRTDVVILKPGQMGGQSRDAVKPLFDHDNVHADLAERSGDQRSSPARLRYQIEEFIRILGLLHLAMGREEYINGVLGVFHLRNKLVDLLIEETAAPHRGGVLHLNRLLTEEQKELVMSLPVPAPERAAIIAAHLAFARAYLPRARRLAAARGIEWPERFEAVTWTMLGDAFSIERPYVPE